MAEWGPFEALDNLTADELRQRLLSLRDVIERAPVPIAIAHDRDCRFISANRALAALLRMPPDANISLTPPPGAEPPYRIQQNGRDMAPDELPMQYAVAHRVAVSNEIEIVCADGSVVYVQNDVEPLYDTHGRIYGCVSVCVDLTERKRAEIALRDADRRKDEFIATLSHELRNPLAPLRTALELMRIARDDRTLIEKARAIMERQLLQLVRITDDLLDVSRITQNKVEFRLERIDLRAVVHSAIETTRPMMDAHAQLFSADLPDAPLWAEADFTRLAQAISNLLNNAAKYTPPGGHITLTAVADASMAAITVADTGVGIPPEMLPRIFDMFTQLQAHRDRAHGGLGIGLTLAKRLVDLHGGTIEAFSDGPGRGSRFTIRLPLLQSGEDRGASFHRAELPAPSGCRVLIAEDNHDTAEMMQEMLQLKGHDVRVAGDGFEAVAAAKAFEPHIAFLDIGMPRMDGYEAARRIRRVLGDRITLVALTGWGQDDDKRLSREAGFDYHLTKPPEPRVLERLIAERAERI